MAFSSILIPSTAVITVPRGRQISWALLKVGLSNLILKIWEPAKRRHKQKGKTKKTYRAPDHWVFGPLACAWLHDWQHLTCDSHLTKQWISSEAGISGCCMPWCPSMKGNIGGHCLMTCYTEEDTLYLYHNDYWNFVY